MEGSLREVIAPLPYFLSYISFFDKTYVQGCIETTAFFDKRSNQKTIFRHFQSFFLIYEFCFLIN